MEQTMATNRAFLLACATVATLSLSAASSTRADAKPCHTEDSTPRQERTCLIRSAIRSVMTEAAKQAAMAKQAAGKASCGKAGAESKAGRGETDPHGQGGDYQHSNTCRTRGFALPEQGL
jgi:hypothetical protein